jgi:hypothetical protein
VAETLIDVDRGSVPLVSESFVKVVAVALPEIPVDVEMGSVPAVLEDVTKAVVLAETSVDIEIGSVLAVSEDVIEAIVVIENVDALLKTPLLVLLVVLTKVYGPVTTGVIVIRVVSPSREMTVVGRSIVVLKVGEVADPF